MIALAFICLVLGALFFGLAHFHFDTRSGPVARRVAINLRVAGAFLWALTLILIVLTYDGARAHDFWINHSGYKSLQDGVHCCGQNDCFEYPAEEVSAQPGGWYVIPLDELVPYNDTQASEDGKFWRCKKSDGTRRCFFAPQPSS